MITPTSPPEISILHQHKFDFCDSYQCEFADPDQKININQVGKSFFTSGPRWIGWLFSIRNQLAGWIGLKTPDVANRKQKINNFKCEPGEQLGLFKVISKTTNEVVLGEDDKHLNFRVSLMLQPTAPAHKRLIVSTTVKFNNAFGRVYFFFVKPFHKLIVQSMVQEMIRQLDQQPTSNSL